MITISLENRSGSPLYEQIYAHIRREIESGRLPAGAKLPSKRKMADHLKVSLRTVENAYAQLMVEGYVESFEKKGYVVCLSERPPVKPNCPAGRAKGLKPALKPATHCRFDLKTNRINKGDFPFSIWTKLMRSSLRDDSSALLEPVHPQGDPELRLEIVKYLRQFRSMEVEPDQVIIGAGTEYLIGLVTELLSGQTFAVEDPNYHKPAKIFASRRVDFVTVPLDDEGLRLDCLGKTMATAVLVSPSHHFPLGTVMSVNRRRQLIHWAAQKKERYLIEDDYDSEFRFALKPVPPLHSLDGQNKVIYMNTFTRSLAPSLRIAYLVLPPDLLDRYRRSLMFYSCTVSEIEQCTLWRFMRDGFYERHLSRIRKIYRDRRDGLLRGLSHLSEVMDIKGQEAGLHLLLTSKKGGSDERLVRMAGKKGVKVYALSGYYLKPEAKTATVIAGYAGYDVADLDTIASLLTEAWLKSP